MQFCNHKLMRTNMNTAHKSQPNNDYRQYAQLVRHPSQWKFIQRSVRNFRKSHNNLRAPDVVNVSSCSANTNQIGFLFLFLNSNEKWSYFWHYCCRWNELIWYSDRRLTEWSNWICSIVLANWSVLIRWPQGKTSQQWRACSDVIL